MNPYLSFSRSSSPWTEELVYSNHVSIGTHKLGMFISGHPTHPDKPNMPNELIIFFSGAGDVHQSWGPVRKVIEVWNRWSETNTQIDPRILLYDRSGLGESERGPNRLTATNAASELLTALRITGLLAHHKSLILVAHSYGAIVAREFLHLLESEPSSLSPPSSPFSTSAKDEPPIPTIKLEAHEDHPIIQIPNVPKPACPANPTKSSPTEDRLIKEEDIPEWSSSTSQPQDPSKSSSPDNSNQRAKIKALVLVDPSTEHQHLYFPHPNPDITALLGNLNFARVTGLRENALNSNHMTKEDWRARAIALSTPSSLAASVEEVSNYVEVCTTLAEKRQLERHVLGDRPLVILQAESWKEYEGIYAAGVEAGNGTVQERQRFRELLDSWKENDRKLKDELLGLTTHYRAADLNIKTDPAGSTVEPIRVVVYEGDEGGRLHVDTGWDTQVTNQQSEPGWGSKTCKLVTVKNCGHNIQLIRPELVVWEIVWALTIVRREQEETDACVESKQERKRKRTRSNEHDATKDGTEVTKKASL
ncbi:hypothetical protein QBC37DRAFT_428593 [Rhypophila decipiens]|uniref:AB hydrolase-1 domain-containing protein n=1 Tax=Rhypophila decipiens TaxID=261697 RepID=A0AAN6Y3D2_9PEZI|nr:hypothetical protein QBC37DRAFT_428593 [Rhypophila decipiens]